MSWNTNVILIDDRVGSAELMNHLPPGSARLTRLQYGDAAFQGKGPEGVPWFIGVERKTVADFFDSFTTGRLQGNQIPGMCNSYNKCYLLLEGITRRKGNVMQVMRYGKWYDLNIGAATMDSIIGTLECVAGVTFKYPSNINETGSIIYSLQNWWDAGYHTHRSHLGFSVEPTPVHVFRPPSLLRRIAKELPGVGWERSAAIEKAFSSVLSMVNADENMWREVPTIGPKLAHRIVEEINGIRT